MPFDFGPQPILRRPPSFLREARQGKQPLPQLLLRANRFVGGRCHQLGFVRPLHQLRGLQQGGQTLRDAVQGGGTRVPGPVLLGPLDSLPVGPDLVHILHAQAAEHVRMPPDQLVGDVAGNLLKIKGAAFPGQLAVEHHLQEQVSQLLFQFVVVPGLDGVEQFIDLLDRMPAQRHVVLLPVPRAAPGRPEPGHDAQQIADCRTILHITEYGSLGVMATTVQKPITPLLHHSKSPIPFTVSPGYPDAPPLLAAASGP